MNNPLKKLKTISLLLFFLLSFNAYSEGTCVEGNCFNGHGVYEDYWGDRFDRNGFTYTGGFVDGKFHGEGVKAWLMDGTYTGGFVNGKKHGKGVEEVFGMIMTGNYVDDAKYGKWSWRVDKEGSADKYTYYLDGESFETVEEWEKEVEVKEKKEREMERIELLAREKKEREMERIERLAREKKEREQVARIAREKNERLTRAIYDSKYSACVLDKGASVDLSVKMMRDAIHNVCSSIAEKD